MADANQISSTPTQEPLPRSALLVREILRREPQEAEHLLSEESPSTIASVLAALPTAKALASVLPGSTVLTGVQATEAPSSKRAGPRFSMSRRMGSFWKTFNRS